MHYHFNLSAHGFINKYEVRMREITFQVSDHTVRLSGSANSHAAKNNNVYLVAVCTLMIIE